MHRESVPRPPATEQAPFDWQGEPLRFNRSDWAVISVAIAMVSAIVLGLVWSAWKVWHG